MGGSALSPVICVNPMKIFIQQQENRQKAIGIAAALIIFPLRQESKGG